jgi:hypothetical protein
MLLAIVAAALPCLLVAVLLRRRLGAPAAGALGVLLWSLAAIAAVTLLPVYVRDGFVPADEAQTACSWDLGGPAPEGFWIFGGTQRLLNTLVFVPSGVALTVLLARWRWRGLRWLPVGVAGLVAWSWGIELTQLELARLDRACDVTDVVDNASGAVLGTLAGVPLALALRPWAAPRRPRS